MEQKPRADFQEPDEEPKETEEQNTQEQPGESEFTKSTLHAAENAKHLGMNAETFQALSLRDRTALNFFDVPENYSETESENNKDQLVFMNTGATYGGAFFPYTPEIQKKIHEDYLQDNLRSPDFGKKLIEENQKWQEQIIESDKKELASKATLVFREIMHSRYANPKELLEINGLETDEFLELLQLEDETSQTTIIEEYIENADIEFDGEQSLAWHIENAKHFDKAYTNTISEKFYNKAVEKARQRTIKMRSIKRVYDALAESKVKRSYRPLKNNYADPYFIEIKYRAKKDDTLLNEPGKHIVNLDKRYEHADTSLGDAISSLQLFCYQNNLEFKLGDIDLKSDKISKNQIDDFIENNAENLNKYFDAHNRPFRAARSALGKITTTSRLTKGFEGELDFEEALKENPNYEKRLKEIYEEATHLDNINIIYHNASQDYLQKIKTSDDNNKTTAEILADFKTILDYAQESRIPLRSETERLEEAESFLEKEYGIKDKISKDAEKILIKNHKNFSAELNESIRAQIEHKALVKKHATQESAKAALFKRLKELDNPDQNESTQQDELYESLIRQGVARTTLEQLRLRIRKNFYQRQELDADKNGTDDSGRNFDLDLIRHSLNLPHNYTMVELPAEKVLIKKAEEELAKRTKNPSSNTQEFVSSEEQYCELRSKEAAPLKEYCEKLSKISSFTTCIQQLKQSIRQDFYLEYQPEIEENNEGKIKLNQDQIIEQDLVRNSLSLPYELDKLSLPSRDKITGKLEEQLKIHHITENARQYIKDFIANETRSSELKIKLALGSRMDEKRATMYQNKREILVSENEKVQYLTPPEAAKIWADNYAKQTILEDKKLEIAQSLGYINKAKSILFTPGYAIIHDEEGQADILPISIEDIKQTQKPGLSELIPFADTQPFCSNDETATARKTLNRILQNEILKNEVVGASKLERRIIEFQEKTGIEFPQIGIEQSTGQLRPQPTEAELNGLEKIYPFFGKFITRAEKSAYYISSPENLIKQADNIHKDFICGSEYTGGYVIFQDRAEGRGVNLESVANILRAKSINGAKALEILAYDAAICDYSNLSQGEISEYLKAVKGKIPADARTFMLLYQKMITNPVELRTCATKLSYCREFSRYCAGGASTPELKAFFDKRSEKAKEK